MKNSGVKIKIVETASQLFYQKGYNLTGVNEIIKEAGVAKATLYHHFRSKEDICLAYLNYKDEVFIQEIKAFTLKVNQGTDQLLALFDFLTLFFKDKDFNGCWCLNTISELPKENEKIWTLIQKQKAQFLHFIETLTVSSFPEKEREEVNALAKQIYLLYESALSESHLHQNDWPIFSARVLCKKIVS